jgi:preprotein translocase subunit SecE
MAKLPVSKTGLGGSNPSAPARSDATETQRVGSKAMAEETLVQNVGEKAAGLAGRTTGFLREVRTEMRKVTTPSAKEVRATTGVVIITVFLFAAYFFVVDKGVGSVVDAIFRWAHR